MLWCECGVLLSLQVSSLKNRLKKVSTTTGDGVSRAFLKAQAALFGSYRNALQIEPVRAHCRHTNGIELEVNAVSQQQKEYVTE